MTSPLDPSQAPVGDVATALMQVDALLARTKEATTTARDAVAEDMLASVTSLDELIDGFCTVIYLYMTCLRQAHEDAGRDVIEDVVPSVVQTLRMMTTSVAPEVIPTMTGLVTAAAMQLSPSLWRRQFGRWTKEEMNALEATALVLAEQINQRSHDDRAAIRLVTVVLAQGDDEA
jgi:hypothetical protein